MHRTTCTIVGGGPAGMMLALLLARRGIAVSLLEVQADFDRDFRGDTVHASTLEVLDQIGLAEPLHQLPHEKLRAMTLHRMSEPVMTVRFSGLRSRFPYVMVMPQVNFLNYLHEKAQALPQFNCVMSAAVRELVREDGKVVGVKYQHAGELHELRSDVVIGTDGRFSMLRKLAGFEAVGTTPPMDVAWLRLPRESADGFETGGFFIGAGRILILLARHGQWQIGYVFPKDGFAQLRARGVEAFRASIAEMVPWMAGRVDSLQDFSDVHVLKVVSDRLTQWSCPGLLLLGDAAHAMSPVGGVGINYAIGDAVVAANLLVGPLSKGGVTDADLRAVQQQREGAVKIVQRMQGVMQRNLVERALRETTFRPPWLMRAILATPGLRNLPARMVAYGINAPRLVEAL